VNLSAKEIKESVSRVLKRDHLAIGRLISLIENHHPDAFKILSQLYPKTGRIFKIGVTGFPGAGKSTLINRLSKSFLENRKKVGVILVDPSSVTTGGALLGDRVRMKDIQTHPDVYIRSMASRGVRGGLAQASRYAIDVLDAAGFEVVLIETVGVGQLEIDIAYSADQTLVLLTPESGDEVQAMKAGLMEVGNFFVVNKMDRDKDKLWLRRLAHALEIASSDEGHRDKPRIFPVSALYHEGLEDLFRALWEVFKKRSQTPLRENKSNSVEREIVSVLEELFVGEVMHRSDIKKKLESCREDWLKRRKSPYEIARTILKSCLK